MWIQAAIVLSCIDCRDKFVNCNQTGRNENDNLVQITPRMRDSPVRSRHHSSESSSDESDVSVSSTKYCEESISQATQYSSNNPYRSRQSAQSKASLMNRVVKVRKFLKYLHDISIIVHLQSLCSLDRQHKGRFGVANIRNGRKFQEEETGKSSFSSPRQWTVSI